MGTHTPIKKISLKELSEQAANDVRNGNPKCFLVDQYIKDAPNEMISSKTEGMLQLVGMLSKVCKVCGAAGADGYINPAITFAQSVKQGDHDETPMDEYEKILQAVDHLAAIWEGRRTAQGLTLAYNAMLLAVFSNPVLYHHALETAKAWLSTIAATMEGPYGSAADGVVDGNACAGNAGVNSQTTE